MSESHGHETPCCQLDDIRLLDDNLSTRQEVQARNVRQLYLLNVEVRALMDVLCRQGEAGYLAERLKYHADQLERQFNHHARGHYGASSTRHFYAQQRKLFDEEMGKVITAVERLAEDENAGQARHSANDNA
ncbi:hypothetical protein [Kushneria phosphatilytica]|uniref:Uncharacterized protein n=1 Tax=Kushneria phosphatilytica TaxID=657387 RepID=A0A1S1NR43_9GAMM|nr:hypothetical protein [Kushneria phosphatilytica]OHV07572.1 hypothetical protein BH688_15260 [Kushneria phosphatilytica]QEL10057.1 hypothetical protein FY550_02200 [Kushneria phosphatilytica]